MPIKIRKRMINRNNPAVRAVLYSNNEVKIVNIETGDMERFSSSVTSEYGVIKKIKLRPVPPDVLKAEARKEREERYKRKHLEEKEDE